MSLRRSLAGGALALLCASAPATAETEVARFSNITFTGSEGARNELVLTAERVEMRPGGDRAQLEGVRVRMEADDGERALTMRCLRGELDLDSNSFRAEGDVEGVTGDGRQFFTSWLRYESDRALVSTEAPVRILDGDRTMLGRGFRYHVREARFLLIGGATVVQKP